ncbi:MAG TPA: YggT family protein [Chromatiales bacterium]|nr:YggT family protein [Chromatiales bacterium]
MSSALIFILRSLIGLYIVAFLLRAILQWVRADIRNPLSQFILRITNPLVLPVRRVVPSIGPADTASLLIALVLQILATTILIQFACIGDANPLQIAWISVLQLVHLVLRIGFFVIIVYVILSWISPAGSYNPAASLLASIVEPLLAPLRRLIPPIGGIDLSPLFAIIAIQAVTMVLPIGQAMSGLLCSAAGRLF